MCLSIRPHCSIPLFFFCTLRLGPLIKPLSRPSPPSHSVYQGIMEKKYRHSGAFSGHNNKMLNVAEIASEERCPELKHQGIISNASYAVRYKRK